MSINTLLNAIHTISVKLSASQSSIFYPDPYHLDTSGQQIDVCNNWIPTNIIQNAADISQNAADISQNTADISQNTADISQNTFDISQNTSLEALKQALLTI